MSWNGSFCQHSPAKTMTLAAAFISFSPTLYSLALKTNPPFCTILSCPLATLLALIEKTNCQPSPALSKLEVSSTTSDLILQEALPLLLFAAYSAPHANENGHPTVEKNKSPIDSHYSDPLSLESPADIPPLYLSSLFTNYKRVGPIRYIQNVRIRHAINLGIIFRLVLTAIHFRFWQGRRSSPFFSSSASCRAPHPGTLRIWSAMRSSFSKSDLCHRLKEHMRYFHRSRSQRLYSTQSHQTESYPLYAVLILNNSIS